jgi:hypothetical protein
MTDILNQFNSNMPFTNANAADFTNLFVVGGMTEGGLERIGLYSEIKLLEEQIQGLNPDIAEQKAQMTKLEEKRDNLKSLGGTLQAFASAYKVTQKAAQTEEEHATNMDTFIETEKTFKKAYAEYVRGLAKGTGETVLDSAIDSGFEQLADYWKLNTDKQDVANAINMMQNPDMYRNAVLQLREASAKAFEVRKESLKKALDDYKKKHLVNAFFNDLFEKYNAFVEPEEANGYIDKNIVPETFYDADTLEEIQPGSDKYKGIMALIDQYDEIYFEETGERLIRTELPENMERMSGYDVASGTAIYQEFRPRDPKDKRSIAALAKEFGFNNIDTESPVEALEVLKAIARSKHGYVPRAQKKLAQALLGFIKPGTLIRFKNGHRTNSTFDPTNGIIVDANFSAEGFENANIPIEFSILNAVMQQVASESLADTEFNDRITALREQFSETLTENDRRYFAYALKNNQQFVAEAMTNADLQAEMGKKPFEGEMTEQTAEAKTMWESFMDSIYEALEKIFGVTRGKSLYQEAMNVITNKLAQPGVAGPSAVPSVLAETETEEDDIDIEEDEPELDQMLRAKFNEIVNAMPAADKVGMNFETWKQSDSVAISMRNKYNADKIKKTVAKPGGATVMTEAEQVRRLTSLGYQISEINNMKKNGQQDDIDNIIKNDIKKKIQIRSVDANGNVTYIEADYDRPIAARPNVIAAIKKAVQTLEDANVGLTADEENYIQRVQVGVNEKTGEPIYKQKEGTPLYERTSHVVKDKFEGTNKEATDRGNIIDLLLRDFLKGDILDIRQFRNAYTKYQKKHSSAVFSEGMLNDLFDKFRSVQILLKSNGLTVISNLPGLYGKIGSRYTAGAVDLIAYDAAGKVYIIDLKTSTQDRRAQYKLETELENEFGTRYSEIKEAIKGGSEKKKSLSETINSTRISDADKERLKKVAEANPTEDYIYFFKDQDARQQNAYKELLRQSTGLVADVLSIFPLLTSKTGKIFTKVDFQKEGKDHSMKVESYDIHQKLGLVNEATYPENPIDRVAKEPTKEPVTETLTQADIEAKKADIERRRKIELESVNKIKQLGTFFELGVPEDAVYKGKSVWAFEQEDLFKSARESLTSIINAKYDAELDELEGEPTEEQPAKELTLNDIKPGDKFTDVKIGYQATVTSVTKDGIVFYDTDKVSGDMPFDEFIKAFVPSNKVSAEKTTEQTVADLRAREQVELRNAIPNIDDYRDSEGNVDESLLSGLSLQLYHMIYNKYDKLISPLLGIEPNPKGKTKPTEGSDKQEMEEEFEEPIPDDVVPDREKTVHETKFENSPFQYKPTATTLGYWNDIEGRIVYFSKKTGEEIFNANRLRKAAQKTFDPKNKKTHPNFKFWWNNLLNDYQRNKIDESLNDPLWYSVGSQDDIYSEEYQIMEALRGMKFKPTKFNKGEFTDVSERVWFSDNGRALDLFVMEDLIQDGTFPEGTDQQDLQNMVIDIIIQYPNGITKADLKEKLREDSLQVKFDELLDKYASQYGIDLNSLVELFDMYRNQLKSLKPIQDNEQEGNKNQGSSAGQEGSSQQRTPVEVAPRFQGKVIVTNFSSSTPLVRDIAGVTYGTDLYAQVLPKFFSPDVLKVMANASISGENKLVNSIWELAKSLSEGKELTADDVKQINSVLGLSVYVKNKFLADAKFPYEDRPKNQKLTLDTLTKLKEAVDNQVIKDARAIADNGGTVVFDNNSLITHPGVDEVLISKSSDDYLGKAPTSESRRNFDNLISNVDYVDISGKDLVDYLKGTETLQYTLDPKLKNIREALSKAEDRLAVAKIITDTGILSDMGVLDQILKEQNLTREELRELSSNAKARFKGTLAYADLAQRIKPGLPIEERIIQYTDADGVVKTGVIMEVVTDFVDRVEVAPYTGKESMSDLQDQSKWVTFTVGEIPYKLFDVKTTQPVTATPDITQQSDDLLKAEQANKAAAVEAFKNKINNDDFKNESVDDAEDDLFDGLQECPF